MTFADDNGNLLEVNGQFAMTKQAVSIFNGDIKGDVSLNFSVDNNSINREVLNYDGPQMLNQVAFTKQPFNRIRNGNVLDRGYIVIQSDNDENLDCFYISGNSNWIQLITGLITKLDYSGITNGTNYSQLITYSNVISRSSATDGIIFPMVDWNNDYRRGNNLFYSLYQFYDSRNDPYNYQLIDFYPCFYMSSLVNEIMNQNGLKLSGNILNDPLYKSMIITPSNGEMKRVAFADSTVLATGSAQSVPAISTVRYTSFTETKDIYNNFSNSTYTATKKISLYFSIKGNLISGSIDIYKNGGLYYSYSSLSASGNFDYTKSPLIPLVPGDTIDFYVSNTNPVSARNETISNLKIENPEVLFVNDYVSPENFLPTISCLDVILFIFNYFGCSVYFDEHSKTIVANIIEKISLESSQDWSEYFLSKRSEYTVQQGKNNYLKLADNGQNTDVVKYNSSHKVKFGEGNITTGNTLKEDNDIFELPITSSPSTISKNGNLLTSVPIVNLIDEGDPMPYTSIASVTGVIAKFSGTMNLIKNNEILRIVDSSGYDMGYFVSSGDGDATGVNIRFSFIATGTGKLYKQRIEFQDVGFRVLSVKPSTNFADFSSDSSFTFYDENGIGNAVSSIAYATFAKPAINDEIDKWKNNLAIDNADNGEFSDPTIKQLYFNKISKFLQNPNIRAKMLLPESVYQGFKFDQFIYLKTEKLTGYFFVQSIVNYVDGNSPVEVNLYML